MDTQAVQISDGKQPAVGEIWKELARGPERFVRVLFSDGHRVQIRSVVKCANGEWIAIPRCRPTNAQIARFNGKRGGYTYVAPPVMP